MTIKTEPEVNQETRALLRALSRPRGEQRLSKRQFVDAQRAGVNFAADSVDNLGDQFPCFSVDDPAFEQILLIGIRHRIAGGDRDVV